MARLGLFLYVEYWYRVLAVVTVLPEPGPKPVRPLLPGELNELKGTHAACASGTACSAEPPKR